MAAGAIRRILHKIETLRTFPRAPRIREDLEGERRVLVSRPYLVIYRVNTVDTTDTVVILHIVHGARDLSALMADD